MDDDEIQAKIAAAIEALYAEEAKIIELDIGERTICSCFAWLLKPHFPDHSVHVEYNRRGVYPKAIELPDAEGELTDNKVFPDIIVHVPGTHDHNLLAIEIKKSTSNRSDERDRMKLAQLRQEYGYARALFIRLSMGEDASPGNCLFAWV